jgi:acetyltransferase-like isoleucine patch superfamily enzyme
MELSRRRTWLDRGLSGLTKVAHYLYWRLRFHSFGWGSTVQRPDMLTFPRAISLGRGVSILKGSRLEAVGAWDGRLPKLVIGDGTSIQFYFHCGAAESVVIGKDVLIAGRVFISDHDHVFDDPELPPRRCRRLQSAPVTIGDGAWLGEGCAILKGVHIGKRAVVAANAVVTHDVPDFTIVAGVPAKPLKRVFTQQHVYH